MSEPYIVSRGYDWAFFLAPPVVATLVGALISNTAFATANIGGGETKAGFFIGALIHAHLVAVFFRSHGNPEIRRRFPLRFFLVPPLLFAALYWSTWAAIIALSVATFWDVWHSGAQTFGFARIYHKKQGGRADEGRALDFWLNQLVYAGPILAGATLMDHLIVLEDFEIFDGQLADFLVLAPADIEGRAGALRWLILCLGAAFIAYYLFAQWQMARRGRPPSPLKVYLLVSTAVCSIVTWGFNPWGEAFFIMNAFHAVQYLALIWASEGGRLTRAIGLSRHALGRPLTVALMLGLVALYGVLVELSDPSVEAFWALTMVVSLMHFWYDAFLWSVRRNELGITP